MATKPNLFIVGAPRSGTTSLYYYLRAHPDVFMSEVKEPHHFCTDFHLEADRFHKTSDQFPYRSRDAYMALFANSSGASIIGEKSTSYLYSATAASAIHTFNPDAKIVVMLRDPAAVTYSWYEYLRFLGEETAPSLAEALELEAHRRQDWNLIPPAARHPSRLFYSQIGCFAHQLATYRKWFPPEQIHSALLEDLRRNPEVTYAALLDFLGLPPPAELPDFKPYNPNREVRFPKLLKCADAWLKPEAGDGGLRQLLYRAAWRCAVRYPKRRTLEPDCLARLQKLWCPEITALSEMLDCDLLSRWGYRQ